MRTEFQLGIERPRGNGRSFLGKMHVHGIREIQLLWMIKQHQVRIQARVLQLVLDSHSYSYQLLLPNNDLLPGIQSDNVYIRNWVMTSNACRQRRR